VPIQYVPLKTLKKIIDEKRPFGDFVATEYHIKKNKCFYYALKNNKGQAECSKFSQLEMAEGWLRDDGRHNYK
jgi:hypothetical protein